LRRRRRRSLAAAQGITGEVWVCVTLDDQSHVITASIGKTPSALLNHAVIEAARASRFQTTVHDCVPVGGTFRYIVLFSAPSAAMASYFTVPLSRRRHRCCTGRARTVVAVTYKRTDANHFVRTLECGSDLHSLTVVSVEHCGHQADR
jgi:hypothetical protein